MQIYEFRDSFSVFCRKKLSLYIVAIRVERTAAHHNHPITPMNLYNQTDKSTRMTAFAIILIAVCVTFLPFLGCAPFFTKG